MFRRKQQQQPEPKPKEDYTPVVQGLLREVNKFQAEKTRRLRSGEQYCSKSMVILDHRQSEVLKKLIHEVGVTPVFDDQTGQWTLFR